MSRKKLALSMARAHALEPPPFHWQPLHQSTNHPIHIFPRFLIIKHHISGIITEIQHIFDRAAGCDAEGKRGQEYVEEGEGGKVA